jgi:hypothetical protein
MFPQLPCFYRYLCTMPSMIRLLIFIFLLSGLKVSFAQSISGNWYGKADVILQGNFNNYLMELNLRQDGSEVEGVISYYFRESYQSFYIRGEFNKSSRVMHLKNIPMSYFRSVDINPVECLMDMEATLTVARSSSSLRGTLKAHKDYRYTCPDVVFNLLRGDESVDVDSAVRNFSAIKKIWKPTPEDVVIQPVMAINAGTAVDEIQKAYLERQNILMRELEMESDSVRITLYDNGDIDGDTVSIFYNKIPVVKKQGINERGLNLYVTLDPSKNYNELSMFADNLGSIPPNTALMIVTDGFNRYEIFLSSTMNQNATVRLKKKKVK